MLGARDDRLIRIAYKIAEERRLDALKAIAKIRNRVEFQNYKLGGDDYLVGCRYRARYLPLLRLWLSRDRDQCRTNASEITEEAWHLTSIGLMSTRVNRQELKEKVYRQQHRRRSLVPRKLTTAQVRNVREEYVWHGKSQQALATLYGISKAFVHALCTTPRLYPDAGGPTYNPDIRGDLARQRVR